MRIRAVRRLRIPQVSGIDFFFLRSHCTNNNRRTSRFHRKLVLTDPVITDDKKFEQQLFVIEIRQNNVRVTPRPAKTHVYFFWLLIKWIHNAAQRVAGLVIIFEVRNRCQFESSRSLTFLGSDPISGLWLLLSVVGTCDELTYKSRLFKVQTCAISRVRWSIFLLMYSSLHLGIALFFFLVHSLFISRQVVDVLRIWELWEKGVE